MAFQVGQRVKCVESDGVLLVEGQVYTISNQCPTCAKICGADFDRYAYINLLGESHEDGMRCNSWRIRYFAPIVSRETDISALKALLVPGAKIRETV